MKLSATLYSATTVFAFVGSYFFKLGSDYAEQYLAIVSVVLLDGFFGIIAGVKTEGFKTYKALKVIKTLITWVLLLTGVFIVERSFVGTDWLSETIAAPFILFQFISALKNAERAGFIKNELLTFILDKIDRHKVTGTEKEKGE